MSPSRRGPNTVTSPPMGTNAVIEAMWFLAHRHGLRRAEPLTWQSPLAAIADGDVDGSGIAIIDSLGLAVDGRVRHELFELARRPAPSPSPPSCPSTTRRMYSLTHSKIS